MPGLIFVLLVVCALIIFAFACIAPYRGTITAVDVFSDKHNGNFRIVQKEAPHRGDIRKLQVETENGWKDAKRYNYGFGDGWVSIDHNSKNIQQYADSIISDYKKYARKKKVKLVYFQNDKSKGDTG